MAVALLIPPLIGAAAGAVGAYLVMKEKLITMVDEHKSACDNLVNQHKLAIGKKDKEIQELKLVVSNQDKKIQELKLVVSKKDKEIQELIDQHESTIAIKDKMIQELIDQHKSNIAMKDKMIQELIDQHKSTIAVKDKAIQEAIDQHKSTIAKDKEIRDLYDRQLREQNEIIAKLQRQNSQYEGSVNDLRGEVQNLRKDLAPLTNLLRALSIRALPAASPALTTSPDSPALTSTVQLPMLMS